ncbi:transporter [Oceanobacillus bengalensis]|uniref:Transporter n=1 Tax=Oceanobacillus bengalensis TaxID=1435466 RepID=A0A494YYG0_9BACI|nr:transporter [Oceanobacillus bengalensis]RKQ15223.1 transporter [Oceanobacillus bengalensis]
MQKVMKIIYEGIMLLLVMMAITSIFTESTVNSSINWIVWAVFTIDFIVRIILAENKWSFMKRNPFLVIAIIPFDQFFQVARIVRVIYLFRIKTITKYYVSPFIDRLSYRSLSMVITVINMLLIIESFVLLKIENSIIHFTDALYVSYGHLLFFGREIFVIENNMSIWLLTITSIVGIIVQGLALQWIFTKIEGLYKSVKNNKLKEKKEINQEKGS